MTAPRLRRRRAGTGLVPLTLGLGALAGLLLLNGDGGGSGGEGGGEGGSGGSGGEGGGEGGGSGSGGGSDGDEFEAPKTKAELEAMVRAEAEKLSGAAFAKKEKALRSKWEKEQAEKAEREKMDEAERLKAEKADTDRRSAERAEKANARIRSAEAKVAAVAAGVKPERVARFLRNVDLDDIEVDEDGNVDEAAIRAAVDDALKEVPEFKGTNGGGGPSGGDFNDDGKPKQLTRDDLKGMTPQEIATAKKEGRLNALLGVA